MGFMDRLTSPRHHAPSRRDQRNEELKWQQQHQQQQQHYDSHGHPASQQSQHSFRSNQEDFRDGQGRSRPTSPHSPKGSRSMPLHRGRDKQGSSERYPQQQQQQQDRYPPQQRQQQQYNQQQYQQQGGPQGQYRNQGPDQSSRGSRSNLEEQTQSAGQQVGESAQSGKGFFKSLMSFAPGKSGKPSGSGEPAQTNSQAAQAAVFAAGPPQHQAVPITTRGDMPMTREGPPPQGMELQQDAGSVRDMKHRISVLESQLQELDNLKRKVSTEQRSALDWRERWNFQNVKLNVMVDMLVFQMLEEDGGGQLPYPTAAMPALGAAPQAAPAIGTAPSKIMRSLS